MSKAPKHKHKHASLNDVVAALIETLRKSGLFERNVVDRLSDLLATTDAYGCCTFMMGGHTYHANMTEAHCDGLQPPGSWSSSPC